MKILRHNLITLFLLIIFTIPILTILSHDSNVSDIENRALASIPTLTKDRLLTGEYFSDWEDYASDHIIGRNKLIKSYTLLNKNILGKSKINNIIIGKEDTLLPYYTEELSNNLDKYLGNLPIMANNLKRLNTSIEEYGGKFVFVGVPGQSSFFRNRYQSYFENRLDYFVQNEEKTFELLHNNNINYLNMNEIFREKPDENYYLKTDHHFSFTGAYLTYKEIMGKMKDLGVNTGDALKLEEMNIVTLENPILGSRNRQIYFLQSTDEQLSIAYPKEEIEYEKVTDGISDPRLYYLPEEGARPSYSVYMEGDHGEIVISTGREDLPNILIFGDSFTNALEPLLYYHFNETRILDLRHYKKTSLIEYIETHKPDVVILVRDDLNYGNLDGNGNF